MLKLFKDTIKWARRDRRVALLILANLGAVVLVVLLVASLLSPQARTLPNATNTGSSTAGPTASITSPADFLPTTTPLPPTVNPTQLASLPNQGRSDAPLPPPGLLASSNKNLPGGNASARSPTAVPTTTRRQ